MPDRIIRDELLTSERYWSISIEAQRLYIHLLLKVDDLARFSGKNYTIRAACFPGQAMDPDKVERLLQELVDTDLIRFYLVGFDRYLFVPRFKQRLRFTKSKYPAPPKEINDIPEEKTDSSQSMDGLESDCSRQKRREEKRREVKHNGASDDAFARFWSAYPKKVHKADAQKEWAKLSLTDELLKSIFDGLLRSKASVDWNKEGGKYIPHPHRWLKSKRWQDELFVDVPREMSIV